MIEYLNNTPVSQALFPGVRRVNLLTCLGSHYFNYPRLNNAPVLQVSVFFIWLSPLNTHKTGQTHRDKPILLPVLQNRTAQKQ
jgi:hypothetical protein